MELLVPSIVDGERDGIYVFTYPWAGGNMHAASHKLYYQ
jgi:hypothetical protein